jgi:hypothetical protein
MDMKGEVQMTRPELALVLGTRVALFVGLGLLLAGRFSSAEKRSAVGRTLMLTGLFTGACIVSQIFGRRRPINLKFDTETCGCETFETQMELRPRKNSVAEAT